MRIYEQLVRVHVEAPMPVAEHVQQRICPVGWIDIVGKAGPGCMETVTIRLRRNELAGSIIRFIVDEEEPAYSQSSMIVEEMRQPPHLVPDIAEDQDIVGLRIDGFAVDLRELSQLLGDCLCLNIVRHAARPPEI